MRIIGGQYRGRRLRTAEGLAVRPTSDRLRETLFNILAPRIEDAGFLDICAGSGAVGLEALSRGARHATLIDKSRRACATIEQNLEILGISEEAEIVNRDAAQALKHLEESGQAFDIIFFDPPYASDIYPLVMNRLGSGPLVAEDGIVVVEHRTRTPPSARYGILEVYREVRQGESALAFYSRVEADTQEGIQRGC